MYQNIYLRNLDYLTIASYCTDTNRIKWAEHQATPNRELIYDAYYIFFCHADADVDIDVLLSRQVRPKSHGVS